MGLLIADLATLNCKAPARVAEPCPIIRKEIVTVDRVRLNTFAVLSRLALAL